MDAAAELFLEKGYERTRMEDIGEKVGLLRGSLYYYIKSKEELLWKVVEPFTRVTIEGLKNIVKSDMTTEDKVKQAIQHVFKLYREYYPHVIVFMGENLKGLDEKYLDAINRNDREFKSLWHEIIKKGKENGDIKVDLDSEIIYQAIYNIGSSIHRWYKIDGKLSLEDIGLSFSNILWEGISNKQQTSTKGGRPRSTLRKWLR
ncbi:MAG: TetR/AcrR family transcriptional regulator [Bacillota bacterium]